MQTALAEDKTPRAIKRAAGGARAYSAYFTEQP